MYKTKSNTKLVACFTILLVCAVALLLSFFAFAGGTKAAKSNVNKGEKIEQLKDGDKVVFYAPKSKYVMTSTATSSSTISAVVQDLNNDGTLTIPDSAAVFNVHIESDGTITFKTDDGKYLSSTDEKTSLTITSNVEPNYYYWQTNTYEDGFSLLNINKPASKYGNYYLDTYNNEFETYARTNLLASNKVYFYNAKETPSDLKTFTVKMDSVSRTFLSKCNMEISDGVNVVPIAAITDAGVQVSLDKNAPKYNIGFTIDRKYFIPFVDVNNTRYETFDWGGAPEGSTNVGISLAGDQVKEGDVLNINLTVGAQPNLNWSGATGLSGVAAEYTMMDAGKKSVDSDNVNVNIQDTDIPEKVEDAVASYDIKVKVDDELATETDSKFNFVLKLDKAKYNGNNYGVFREHNGQFEEIDAKYDSVSGNLSFSSDKFSSYTIVNKTTEPPAPTPSDDTANTGETQTPQTGDMNVLQIFGLIACAAVAGFCLIRKRNEA